MNNNSILVKRKLASFLLFYRQIFSFSILVSIALFGGDYMLGFINPDSSSLINTVINFIGIFAFRLPTYFFIGALGLTHFVQKNQYYYYRNQGCTIKSLIIKSWLMNCFICGFFLILSKIVGTYG